MVCVLRKKIKTLVAGLQGGAGLNCLVGNYKLHSAAFVHLQNCNSRKFQHSSLPARFVPAASRFRLFWFPPDLNNFTSRMEFLKQDLHNEEMVCVWIQRCYILKFLCDQDIGQSHKVFQTSKCAATSWKMQEYFGCRPADNLTCWVLCQLLA